MNLPRIFSRTVLKEFSESTDITKSSRHSKIAGDFGETLVLYWLSKYGFECASVDHTGIDLIARHPRRSEVMGISVKSRTRTPGKESDYVIVKTGDFEKVKTACGEGLVEGHTLHLLLTLTASSGFSSLRCSIL